MSVLGIIPARKGSQRCPGKNWAIVGAHPLVAWSIIRAQYSGIFTELIVTTDDIEVAAIAKDHKCRVVNRPAGLAMADTPMLPVVRHAVGEALTPPDVVVLLQPTSPFRSVADIQQAYDLLSTSGGDAVVSVTEPPDDLVFELGHARRMRPLKQAVVPNGALYLITGSHLRVGGDWYSGVTYAYSMPKERSLDIDTDLDLQIARLMVREKAVA